MRIISYYLLMYLLSACVHMKAQNLGNQLKTIVKNNDMMGASVVVFCESGIVESLAVGKSDYSRNIRMTIDSKYRIASISKTITAIAIMQLVERNLLNLDDDISSLLGFEVLNPHAPEDFITVRMLLSHTSSIIDGSTYSEFLNATVYGSSIPDLKEILVPSGTYYIAEQFNKEVPGTNFSYSNINYVILGTIVEKVTNLRFDVYCNQHISDPLGIDASFNVSDLTHIDQLAVLYRKRDQVWTPQVDDYQGIKPIHDNLAGYTPGTNGARFAPQGGFRCSAKDLATIFLVLMNKGSYADIRLLSEASCETMFANAWTYNGNNGDDYHGLFRSWGLGIHRVTSTPGKDIVLPESQFMLGHAGEAYGLVSAAYFDTQRKTGFVFMNNGIGIGYQSDDRSAYYTIEQEIFEAIEKYGKIGNCVQTDGKEH